MLLLYRQQNKFLLYKQYAKKKKSKHNMNIFNEQTANLSTRCNCNKPKRCSFAGNCQAKM